jgi:uncharacterized DUF497 family protein
MSGSRYINVEWDEKKNTLNKKNHNVSFEEAVTVFADPLELMISDPDHSGAEHRYLSIGHSSDNRLLVVSFTERGMRIRLISARKPSKSERETYEETSNAT